MLSLHSSLRAWAALLVALPLAPAGQDLPPVAPAIPAPSASTFTIFGRGNPIGTEQIAVARTADGWTITSTGRINAPVDIVTRKLELRYDPNWKPLELTLDATVRGQAQTMHTAGPFEADVLLPSPFFAPFEALAARLRTTPPGSTLTGLAQRPVSIRVGDSSNERIQTASETIDTKRTHVTLTAEGAPQLDADIWADQNGRLLRLSIPVQGLEVVREDIASVAARQVPISRPNDEQVKIPSNGFSLAGTLSRPATASDKPLPAVVLVGGSGPTDRDEVVFGIPILGQLAGSIADAGFITLRYDKRGVGQSGGRLESASLDDFAEDVRAAVKLLANRKDVDPRRIAVVGHSEGGSVALIAASKDKRIAAVGLVATNGIPGSDLILEQQRHLLSRSGLSEADKQAKVDLQKKINEAVMTGKGWDELPAATRRQVDNAEFQSILTNDPAKILPKVRQPILVVQGELDTQVAPANADRLDTLARQRKNRAPVQLVKIPGINHLLVPAATGEVEEYATLKDKQVSPAVTRAVVDWLRTISRSG